MYMALSSLAYRAFAMPFEAMEANFFCQEHILQIPGLCRLESFTTKENLNYDGNKSKDSMSHDDVTIKTSNVTSLTEGAQNEKHSAIRMNALTFNPPPPLEEDEEHQFVAANNQAKLNHTFVCPVFALQNELAAGNTIPEWYPRAHLGLNLGPSPMHARNVYIVLNLSTMLVSLQYHCCFNDFFETMKYGGPDVLVSSTWQQLARLNRTKESLSPNQTTTLNSCTQAKTPSDISILSEQLDDSTENQDSTIEFHNKPTEETVEVTTPQESLIQNRNSQEREGASQKFSVNMSAGISR
jgi:hypothetical protein